MREMENFQVEQPPDLHLRRKWIRQEGTWEGEKSLKRGGKRPEDRKERGKKVEATYLLPRLKCHYTRQR
jgi:hypothetical protein